MALIAHQTGAPYSTFSSRPVLGNRPLKLKAFVSFKPIGRASRCISLKRRFSSSIQSQSICSSKGKPCNISSFKGNNAQYDESEKRTNYSNVSKNAVQLSYAAQEKEETIMESPDIQKGPLCDVSEAKEETIAGSPVIQQLFKKWLIMFKGNNAQYDESEKRTNNSNVSKNAVQLSYTAQEKGETIMESPDIQKGPLSNVSEEKEEETIAGSPVIQRLFKKWLVMLRTQNAIQPTEEIFKESLPKAEISEHHDGTLQVGAVRQLMKAAFGYFLGLDAAVKFPPLIFIPWYLVVNIIYGAQVSKELTPLWVIGPVIVALYIKVIQGLCALYVFSFKQTIKLVKTLPTCYQVAYNYINEGKLREFLSIHLWQPVARIRSSDYKELSKKKLKEFMEWAEEKRLDFIELIWPYHFRLIRFLKRSNLIS